MGCQATTTKEHTQSQYQEPQIFDQPQQVEYYEGDEQIQEVASPSAIEQQPMEQQPERERTYTLLNNQYDFKKDKCMFPSYREFRKIKQQTDKVTNTLYQNPEMQNKTGKGIVFKSNRIDTDTICAVKTTPFSQLKTSQEKEAIKNELLLVSSICHPHIVKVNEVYVTESKYSVQQEFCQGGSLKEVLAKCNRMGEEDSAHVVQQLLLAVNYLHQQNIVHRNLATSTVMFQQSYKLNVKICGFSAAKELAAGTEFEGHPGADPCFTAPEVLQRKKYNEKIDVWSIGAIAFNMLCGDRVFLENEKAKMMDDNVDVAAIIDAKCKYVSNEARDFLKKTLNRNPEERETCKSLLKHPFLATWDTTYMVKDKNGEQMLENIYKFTQMNTLMKSIVSMLVNFNSNTPYLYDDFSLLEKSFKSINVSHTGHITEEEFEGFAYAYPSSKIGFKSIDLRRAGALDYLDFCTIAIDHRKLLTKKNLRAVFKLLDHKHDQNIDVLDLKTAFNDKTAPLTKFEQANIAKEDVNLEDDDGKQHPEVILTKMLNLLNADNKGQVNLDTFNKAIEDNALNLYNMTKIEEDGNVIGQ